MTKLLLSKAHYPVTALGPGRRAGIWTQGCTIQCPGCLSRDTWAADPGMAIEVDTVLGWLDSLRGPVDGITVSGGEPFQQPAALADLLTGIRDWRAGRPIDVLVYSGYALSRLQRAAWSRKLLACCDALVAGPYVDRLNDSAPTVTDGMVLRGSSNQRIVALSDLGRERYAAASRTCGAPRMQVAVEADRIYYIGIPRRGDMQCLTERLERAGIHPGEVSWRL